VNGAGYGFIVDSISADKLQFLIFSKKSTGNNFQKYAFGGIVLAC